MNRRESDAASVTVTRASRQLANSITHESASVLPELGNLTDEKRRVQPAQARRAGVYWRFDRKPNNAGMETEVGIPRAFGDERSRNWSEARFAAPPEKRFVYDRGDCDKQETATYAV
jgi:hypothetical protein